MFCPNCGIQSTDDNKFCRSCGANLRGVRDAMLSREEKIDWNKTWVANMFLSEEERDRIRGITPEKKRNNEMKEGVITAVVGLGVMIFLYFFMIPVANKHPDDAEILRSVWMVGIIPLLIGIAMFFNAMIFGNREMKRSKQRPAELPEPFKNPAAQLGAKTTNELSLAPDSSITEDTTAHLPEHAKKKTN